MALFQFRLPDIGEGIAEAEIVAWHVKVGDEVKEDQQLADMMTDKATVEMESPVAGRVVKLAGAVGDQIPIGSVLVELETDAAADAAQQETGEEAPLGDGLVEVTEGIEEAIPTTETADNRREGEDRRQEEERRARQRQAADRRQGERRSDDDTTSFVPSEVEGRTSESVQRPSTSLGTSGEGGDILASPAVRRRARDLGIELSQVRFAGDRIRHADLDAYLLYSGGSVPRPGAPRRQDEVVKVVGLRRPHCREYAGGEAPHPAFHAGRGI